MSIDAMKQALEALEMLAKWEHPASNITTKSGRIYPHHVAKNSATTLRLAIEQAEKQEPVAWQWLDSGTFRKSLPASAEPGAWRALYTDPPQRQPLTEEQVKVLNFLLGADDLDGVWFGERHPTERGAFWWRDRLRRVFVDRKHGIGGGE